MKINFVVNDVSFMDYKTQTVHWGWEPTDQRLGGTEESVVRWAEELVNRGHEVTVFKNGREDAFLHNGVEYIPSSKYVGGGDICINIKNSELKPKEPTLYLTNETNANSLDLSPYLGVIWPSEYASDSIPVNNPKKFILPHGYDDKKIKNNLSKINKQVLYSASPDRGLDLLAQIWPTIVEFHPDAHLFVTYGGEIYTPNTTCGTFSEEEMNELYNTSDIWCYPCTGGELFGMNAIKAQAGGAIPVYFPTMSLAEVVKSGIDCTDIRDMFNQLNALLDDQEYKDQLRQTMTKLELPTWQTTTDRLIEIINSVV